MATTKPQIAPPTPVERVLLPFQKFFNNSATGGILLIGCTVLALVWANSPWADSYLSLWNTVLTVGPEGADISKPLILWINDGLMAIFFFVVGLEIKRELLVGELSSPRKAALPAAAAIGGLALPGLIYFFINAGTPGVSGWAIPAATDIAFALGVLALLGSRVPTSLKVFLTALAIIDDIGAVLIIALFYTAELSLTALGIGGIFLIGLILSNRLGVRHVLVYGLLGTGLWVCFLKSGVHATIAGVICAMTIPARTRIDADDFTGKIEALLKKFRSGETDKDSPFMTDHQRGVVQAMEDACDFVESPAHRLEHGLHPWVVFFIMPIFATANAGVILEGDILAALTSTVALGIMGGLLLGKQIGITALTWLAIKTGLATKPMDISWRQIYGAGWLAGIGFTMSLFITALAFDDPVLVTQAKIGILAASLVAGIVGYVLLRTAKSPKQVRQE